MTQQKYVIKKYMRGAFDRVIGDNYSRDEASDLLGLLRSGAHESGLSSRWSSLFGKMSVAFSDPDQTEYIASPQNVVALHNNVVPIIFKPARRYNPHPSPTGGGAAA